MKKTSIIIFLFIIFCVATANAGMRIVIVGSSTAEGIGLKIELTRG